MRVGLLLAFASVLTASVASADVTSEQGGELYSVEKRRLLGHHELSASIGVLPLDAFVKGFTVQASYTYNFNHLFGWEVFGGVYSFKIDTGLEEELRDRFEVVPELDEELNGLLYSNFVFRPLYGKLASLNQTTLAAELFFVVGPTVGIRTASSPFGIDYGAGVRFFLGRHLSVRFDIRDFLLFPGFNEVQNNLYLSLGISLTFGFDDEYSADE